MQINETYLFNFTEDEKKSFKEEQEYLEFCEQQGRYHNTRPMSKLQVKYQINRILLNDESLIKANFRGCSLSDIQAHALGEAFKRNTHCKKVDLSNTTISPEATRDLALALAPKVLKHLNVSGMTEDKEDFTRLHKKEWRFLYFMFGATCRWDNLTISNTKENHKKVDLLSQEAYRQGVIFFENTVCSENESFKVKFRQNISKFTSSIFGKHRQKE